VQGGLRCSRVQGARAQRRLTLRSTRPRFEVCPPNSNPVRKMMMPSYFRVSFFSFSMQSGIWMEGEPRAEQTMDGVGLQPLPN
jgi:hypothetical protein